ncbi:MAG: aminotransferase class V-fold PLP-dependent enzyme [Dactylosporangium sp.]|jgi:hypothetical protein|nr:aminotransferase class V-fold PLP-dependent enzyme [Dactylosporangium sp.]
MSGTAVPATGKPIDPADVVAAFKATPVRPQMNLEEAVACQFRLVDAVQAVMGSDLALTEDYGQVRALGTLQFGAGGRTYSTARVEEVLAGFFGVGDAVLVPGAGTGAIRAMLNSALEPAQSVIVHDAPVYKTALPVMRHMGLQVLPVDFNDLDAVREAVRQRHPAAVYFQYVPQQLGDRWQPDDIIAAVKETSSDVQVLADDNYAVMRVPSISVQSGADASAFSFFKLLAAANIGCVLANGDVVSGIRRDLSSAGCQVQGPDAMEALRSLVYAPVSLALQDRVVVEASDRLNDLIAAGRLPGVAQAVAGQPAIRSVVLIFEKPVAEAFLASAWRHGSPSRSVGEEAAIEVLPLFTYLTGTFLRGTPGLERYCLRINPMRGGTEAIVRVVLNALADPEFQLALKAA